jgi:predicted DNA-binding ribbon-helix-helix protein
MTIPKRRGGRRPLMAGHKSQAVNIRIPDPLFDELDAIARQRDVPLRQVVREMIARGMRTPTTTVSSF